MAMKECPECEAWFDTGPATKAVRTCGICNKPLERVPCCICGAKRHVELRETEGGVSLPLCPPCHNEVLDDGRGE